MRTKTASRTLSPLKSPTAFENREGEPLRASSVSSSAYGRRQPQGGRCASDAVVEQIRIAIKTALYGIAMQSPCPSGYEHRAVFASNSSPKTQGLRRSKNTPPSPSSSHLPPAPANPCASRWRGCVRSCAALGQAPTGPCRCVCCWRSTAPQEKTGVSRRAGCPKHPCQHGPARFERGCEIHAIPELRRCGAGVF